MLYYIVTPPFIRSTIAGLVLTAAAAQADVPNVVADIPPVHSLVAQVMGDLGTPKLVMEAGASPHGYAMRPSEAAALEAAKMVVWIGPALTPWLEKPVETLASDADVLTLLEAEGTRSLPFRDDPGAEDAKEHSDHDEHADHDDHAEGHVDAHGHDHGDIDPHAWLDPDNARRWLDAIADRLAAADPENANTYRRNAQVSKLRIKAMAASVAATLAPVREKPFVVYHDAYQYFESRFDLNSAGSIALGDAASPGAARIAEVRERVVARGVVCVFAEPLYNEGLVTTVLEGTDVGTAVLDPLGGSLELGPTLYGALLKGLAKDIATCS